MTASISPSTSPTPAVPHGPGLLNPTLAVEAYFMVPATNDLRRTQFPLREYPDVARWLLSFLDFLLAKQGVIPGPPRLAEPPGGVTRERLIEGDVLLVEPRPDGSAGLRLNPHMEMGLYIRARRRGEAALDTNVPLAFNPEAARWLLTEYVGGHPAPPTAAWSPGLVAGLRDVAALVDALPSPDVCYPDPAAGTDPADDLAAMGRVFFQPAGAPLPDEVRALLGAHTPALPPGVGIVWGEAAGTGIVHPVLWPAGLDADAVRALAGRDAAARAREWARTRAAAQASLRDSGYCVLPAILAPAQREALRRYVRQLAERGYFPDVGVGDTQVALRRSIHKEPTIAALHAGLTRLVAELCDLPLSGSFCQLGVYEAGAVLEKHTDRPQCVRNLSFIFDMQGPHGEPEPWPLWFEVRGQPVAAMLAVGDGAIYCGTETPHWRDALAPEHRAIAAFYFFVPPDFRGTRN